MRLQHYLALAIACATLPSAAGTFSLTPWQGNPFASASEPTPAEFTTPLRLAASAEGMQASEEAIPANPMLEEPLICKVMREQGLRPGVAPAYVPAAEEQEMPLTFIGFLQYAERGGRMFFPYGIYSFSTQDGLVRHKLADVEACLNHWGAYVGNQLMGSSNIPLPYVQPDGRNYFYDWDVDTWTPAPNSKHGKWWNVQLNDGVADPVTGTVYGFDWEENLLTFDPATFTTTTIGGGNAYDYNIKAFVVGDSGYGYFLKGDGGLYKISLADGSREKVGDLDFTAYYALQSMTFSPETGKYYLCISEGVGDQMLGRLCELNVTDATTRLIGYLPDNEEYTCLKVVYTAMPGYPGDVTDLTLAFDGDSKNGHVAFTVPSVDAKGNAMGGNLEYTIELNDEAVYASTASAGQKVTYDVTATNEGWNKAAVVLKNDKGSGRRNAVRAFQGVDTPMAHDVNLDIADDGTATLTWTAERGENDGYLAQTPAFDIVRYPGNELVAQGVTAGTFTEQLGEREYAGIYYTLTPTDGKVAKSNVVTYGTAFSIPFSDAIEADALDRYAVVDANNDGTTWHTLSLQMYDGSYDPVLVYEYSTEEAANDWLVTPPVHMVPGYAYQIAYKLCAVGQNYSERLAVAMGQGDDPAKYEVIQEPFEFSIPLREYETEKNEASVTAEGDYRFAFHATSDKFQNMIVISGLDITCLANLKAPASCENLLAVPAEEGELSATISFDVPIKTYDGNDLTDLQSVTITRGDGTTAATLTDVKAGQHIEYVDDDASNGWTDYTVTANNPYGPSVAQTTRIYVGIDAPYAPTELAIIDNLDGTATLEWQAPATTGVNGGYVDTDDLTYTVYTIDNKNGAVVLAEEVEGTTYTIDELPAVDIQTLCFYGVDANNELGKSGIAEKSLVVGTPEPLPFEENFNAVAGLATLWYYDSSEYKNAFNMYTGTSADGDNMVAGYLAQELGNWSTLHSAKIALSGAEAPRLSFAHLNQPGYFNNLTVAMHVNGQPEPIELFTVDYSEAEGNQGWKYESIDLTPYKDAQYVTFDFKAEVYDENNPMVAFDDVNVVDAKDDDLTVKQTAQAHATRGQRVTVDATVHNLGNNAAGFHAFKVNLFINGEVVATQQGKRTESLERTSYTFRYPTAIDLPEQNTVQVKVEYDSDLNAANDCATEQTLILADPMLNKVNDLTGDATDSGMALAWSAPDAINHVLDSFEGYLSFVTQGFGDWTVYDGDGINSLTSILSTPSGSQPMAFIPFDFQAAGYSLEANPDAHGHTGSQVLASYMSMYYTSDDWLISPELSGQAQTISLWASHINYMMADTFEALYSTDGNDWESFGEKVGEGSISDGTLAWSELTFDLPEGAKYFAIHNNTSFGGVLLLDDIKYEGAALVLTGYNVYRDGKKIGTTTSTDYNDPIADASEHSYVVTAVYTVGESGPSNIAGSGAVGIQSLNSDKGMSKAEYYDLLGRRVISPAAGNIYIRKAAGRTDKVMF